MSVTDAEYDLDLLLRRFGDPGTGLCRRRRKRSVVYRMRRDWPALWLALDRFLVDRESGRLALVCCMEHVGSVLASDAERDVADWHRIWWPELMHNIETLTGSFGSGGASDS